MAVLTWYGFSARSEVPRWIKTLLLSLPEDALRRFLIFVCGTPSLPAQSAGQVRCGAMRCKCCAMRCKCCAMRCSAFPFHRYNWPPARRHFAFFVFWSVGSLLRFCVLVFVRLVGCNLLVFCPLFVCLFYVWCTFSCSSCHVFFLFILFVVFLLLVVGCCLWSQVEITVRCQPRSPALPAAHTCFFQLDVPDYDKESVLRHKLLQAVNNTASFDVV